MPVFSFSSITHIKRLFSSYWISAIRVLCVLSHSVMSNSLQPHGLYSPWNSPGQNTGVGSLSLLQAIFPTQGSNPGLPHCRWIFYQLSHKGSPRILGSLFLLQWIFPTQELNRGLLHCRQILYQLTHQGSPRILEWVAYPFSREIS